MRRKIFIILSKLRRSLDILCDRSEVFEDYPLYRFTVIKQILKDKY